MKQARSGGVGDIVPKLRSGHPERLGVRFTDDEAEAAMVAGVAGVIPLFDPEAEQALPTAMRTPFAHGATLCTQHCFTGVSHQCEWCPDHPCKQKHDEAGGGTFLLWLPPDQSQSNTSRT